MKLLLLSIMTILLASCGSGGGTFQSENAPDGGSNNPIPGYHMIKGDNILEIGAEWVSVQGTSLSTASPVTEVYYKRMDDGSVALHNLNGPAQIIYEDYYFQSNKQWVRDGERIKGYLFTKENGTTPERIQYSYHSPDGIQTIGLSILFNLSPLKKCKVGSCTTGLEEYGNTIPVNLGSFFPEDLYSLIVGNNGVTISCGYSSHDYYSATTDFICRKNNGDVVTLEDMEQHVLEALTAWDNL